MKQSILGLVLCLLCGSGLAQNVPFEAVRIADALGESGWQSVEQALPVLISGLQNQLKTEGATEKASTVLSTEIRRSLTRDNVVRAIAQGLTDKFSEAELKELSAFLQSKLGRRYLQFIKDSASDQKYLAPILKQACDAATSQLDLFERGSINGTCGRF
jgi:hypothetical protein